MSYGAQGGTPTPMTTTTTTAPPTERDICVGLGGEYTPGFAEGSVLWTCGFREESTQFEIDALVGVCTSDGGFPDQYDPRDATFQCLVAE